MASGNSEPEPTDGLKSFGSVLRAFRERAGLTQEGLALLIDYSLHQVASIERGRRFPSPDFVNRAEEALQADGILRAAARPLSRKKAIPQWFEQWAELETEAIALHAYECRVLPGLLQCESYARAVLQSRMPPLTDEEIGSKTAARLERSRMLAEKPNAAFSFVVEQAVLERRTGGREVTRAQLGHLLSVARLRNVEMQIMPTVQEQHAGLAGPMYLAETAHADCYGYFEGQGGSVFLSDRKAVGVLYQRYGKLRAQALRRSDSVSLLERMRGDL